MKSKIKILGLILLSLILITGIQSQTWRECIRVVDGDTIVLDGNEKVRLIGVDTPETKDPRKPVQYFGKEASEFTRGLVEGQKVRLEFDQNKIDKYDRTLAYVYIKQGYGHVYTIFPFKYLEKFRQYEKEARKNESGLWAPREEKKLEVNEDTIVYITRTGRKYHTTDCRYLSKSKIPITLKEAIQRGYTPCSVCRPPTLKIKKRPKAADTSASITVYITKTGKKYHRGSCSYLRRSKIPISLKEACARGYTPCSRCKPPRCK